MKKKIYAPAALIGAVVASSAAIAQTQDKSTRYLQQNDLMGQSAFSASVKGSINWFVGYAENKKMPKGTVNKFDINSYNRMFFDFNAALKNGIDIGVKSEIFVGTSEEAGSLDNTYMYMQSRYGKVIIGRHDNVSEQLGVYTEDLGALGVQETSLYDFIINPMLNSPVNAFDGVISDNLSASYINTDAELTKISYITPIISGFQAGITYAPAGNTNGINDNVIRDITPISSGNITVDATVITAVYKIKAQSMDYGISAGYGFNTSFGDTAVDNLKQWNIGASIACDNIKITGAYKYLDWGINGDAYVFDAGVSYSYGVYGLSFGFIGSSGDKDMGDVVQDSLLLTGTYNMAKGIDLFGTIGWGDYKGSTGTENDGWSVISGMMINF